MDIKNITLNTPEDGINLAVTTLAEVAASQNEPGQVRINAASLLLSAAEHFQRKQGEQEKEGQTMTYLEKDGKAQILVFRDGKWVQH